MSRVSCVYVVIIAQMPALSEYDALFPSLKSNKTFLGLRYS